MTPTFRDSLVYQLKRLSELKPNWDGYGGPVLSAKVLARVVVDVAWSATDQTPPVALCPGGDGSLQAEWHLKGVELEYHVSPDQSRYLWIHDRVSGAEMEFFAEEATAKLGEWMATRIRHTASESL
jgi:hypothetical protein